MIAKLDESLLTGIENIDNQHIELFNRISQFVFACSQNKGSQEIVNTINYLESYITVHFHDEELLQQESGYPEYNYHKQLHEQFVKDFIKLKKQYDGYGASSYFVREVMQTLINWLKNHIGEADKDLAAYLKSKKL